MDLASTDSDQLAQWAEQLRRASQRTPQIVLDALLPASGPLPPLTFRTWLALERIESPLTRGDAATPEDVIAAIAIWRRPQESLESWQAGRLCRDALEALPVEVPPKLLAASVPGRIREAFTPIPRDLPEDRDFRPPGVGWVLALLEGLMAEYGCSLEAALDTPIAVAFCLRAAAAERQGAPPVGPSFTERAVLQSPAAPAASSASAPHPRSHQRPT